MGGPGSGNPGQPRGAGGKFITLALEIAGADKAAKQLEKVSESTDKLKTSTDGTSQSIEKNTSETDTNTSSQQRNNDTTKQGITAGFSKIIMLQASTSAINQGTGAMYKMIAGGEAMGLMDQERAVQLQKSVRQLEFFTGIMELGLAVTTIYTTVTELNTAAKGKNAVATDKQTVSQLAHNRAMLANPYVALAVGLISIVAMLVIFDRETGKVTDSIKYLNEQLERLVGWFIQLGGIADNNPIKRLVESDTMNKLNDTLRLESLGIN